MQVQPAVDVREASPAEKVPAMAGGSTAYQYRKVLNRQSADSIKILYDIPKSEFKPGCCQKLVECCTCSCLCTGCKCSCAEDAEKAVEESEYTWVMENRMEFNRPYLFYQNKMCAPCTCSYRAVDAINTAHFDDDMFDYIGRVSPPCLQEACCGSHGEVIEFKRRVAGCPSANLCGVTVASINVPHGDGEKVVQIITSARDSARAKMA